MSGVDVDCVNNSCTFAGVATTADICNRMTPDPPNDKCEQAEAQLMTLLLNTCRLRLGHPQPIDSSCGPDATVGQAIASADSRLCEAGRDAPSCLLADCATRQISTGQALWANSLRIARVSATSVRLRWQAPFAGPDGMGQMVQQYSIFRRRGSEAPFDLAANVSGQTLEWTDPTATESMLQYEVHPVW